MLSELHNLNFKLCSIQYGWIDGRTYGQTDKLTERFTERQAYIQADQLMDGRIDG
jgi:hypothetical protein